MRRLTREEAANERGVTLRTLDRWIAEGSVKVERVQFGRQTRVYVLMDYEEEDGRDATADESAVDMGVGDSITSEAVGGVDQGVEREGGENRVEDMDSREIELELELTRAQERVRGLEELVEILKAQNALEQSRYGQLYQALVDGTLALPEAKTERRPWWKFWERAGG